jgi:hypothetical protein
MKTYFLILNTLKSINEIFLNKKLIDTFTLYPIFYSINYKDKNINIGDKVLSYNDIPIKKFVSQKRDEHRDESRDEYRDGYRDGYREYRDGYREYTY